MKKLLLSLATKEIRSIAEPFLQNHKVYAEHNGYVYQCAEDVIWEHLHPSFSKVAILDKALKDGCEFVIWADADVAFTNMQIDLKRILSDKLAERPELFLTGKQQLNWAAWKFICAGLLVLRNTPDAHAFMAKWIDYCLNGTPNVEPGKRVFVTDHPYEQFSFDGIIREVAYHGIYAATGKEIGCFCPEIWTDGERWFPGYPTLHFAGPASFQRRADCFKMKYAHQVFK